MKLVRERNLSGADDVYERLVALHADCSPEESMRLNARLIITLFNHIGDADVLGEAIAVAAGANKGASSAN